MSDVHGASDHCVWEMYSVEHVVDLIMPPSLAKYNLCLRVRLYLVLSALESETAAQACLLYESQGQVVTVDANVFC